MSAYVTQWSLHGQISPKHPQHCELFWYCPTFVRSVAYVQFILKPLKPVKIVQGDSRGPGIADPGLTVISESPDEEITWGSQQKYKLK